MPMSSRAARIVLPEATPFPLGLPVALNAQQEKLSDEMVRYWTTAHEASQWKGWPLYTPEQQNVLSLMLPRPHVLPVGRFASEHHCGFWGQGRNLLRRVPARAPSLGRFHNHTVFSVTKENPHAEASTRQ